MEFENLLNSYSRLSRHYAREHYSFQQTSGPRLHFALPDISVTIEASGGANPKQNSTGLPIQVAPFGYGPTETTFSPHNCSPEISGTTVISLHIGGYIYSGADGRVVGKSGNIMGGNHQKLFSLNENKVLGTICGRMWFGETVILKKAKEQLANSVSPTDIIAELKRDAENWTKSEALKWGSEKYPARLGLCGFENDEPFLLLSKSLSSRGSGVNCILEDGKKVDGKKVDGKKAIVSTSGNGSEYALTHLRKRKSAIFEPNANINELVLECLAVSALHNPGSGGNFQNAVHGKGGELVVDINGPHLIEQIVKSFDKMEILKVSLIHITYNVLYNVCGGEKDEMNALISKTFNGVKLVNVLGIQHKKKITARLVVFKKKSALSSALRSLKEKEESLIPHRSFFDLKTLNKNQKPSWSLVLPKLQVFEDLSKDFYTDSW